MGKVYKIKIDNEVYTVEIDEVNVAKSKVQEVKSSQKEPYKEVQEVKKEESQGTQVKEESTKSVTKEETTPQETLENGVEYIVAPLPGKILKVFVSPGASVKKGDVLLTIEAMKMENEMFAPFDGKVIDVYVKPQDRVETNKKLIKLGR